MDNQPSQKEIEHEALLERARKYVAEEQIKKEAEVVTENSNTNTNEQKFTTREERFAEVMPRAQEFIKVTNNDVSLQNAALIMGVDESYIRGPDENPIQYPYTGFAHPEKLDTPHGQDGLDVGYANDFEDAFLGYLGYFNDKENIATPRVSLNEEMTVEEREAEEARLIKYRNQEEKENKTVASENPSIVDKVENVKDTVTETIENVTEKAVQYKNDPGTLVQDIGNGVGNLLSSFSKGLNSLGEKVSSYTEDPSNLGQDIQNGAKKVVSTAEETISSGASLFSLDSLKSGLSKVDSFLQEQQAKNEEISASRKNNNMP